MIRSIRTSIHVFATCLLACPCCVHADGPCSSAEMNVSAQSIAEWAELSGGVRLWRGGRSQPGEASLILVSVDPGRHSIEVGDMRRSFENQKLSAVPFFSLKEVSALQRKAFLFSSAGYTKSMMSPIPVGLLKHGGVVLSPLTMKEPLLSGIVCIDSVGHASVLASQKGERGLGKKLEDCVDAVQAGPLLIDKGRIQEGLQSVKYARSFVAIDSNGKVIFGNSLKPVGLDELACRLSTLPGGVASALNLQGDSLGGLILRVGSERDEIGGVDETIASYFLVRMRQ